MLCNTSSPNNVFPVSVMLQCLQSLQAQILVIFGCGAAEFAAKPNTVVKFKKYIKNKAIEIPVSTIRRVKAHFVKRLRTYVEIDVGHLSVFIFHN